MNNVLQPSLRSRRETTPRAGSNVPAIPATEAGAHLVFTLGGQPYACSIASIERLLRAADVLIRPVTNKTRPWLVGTLHDQGQALPVVRLDLLWSIPQTLGAAASTQSVVICRHDNARVALLVGGCRGVLKALPPVSARRPLSLPLTNNRGVAFESIMTWGTELLVEVRLERLLGSLDVGSIHDPGKELQHAAQRQ